jgi:periplasmic copper chaperone A
MAMALVALGVTVGPAGAHVGIVTASTSAASTTDSVTTVTFAFDHGCGSSPTMALDLQLPAGAVVATPVPTTDGLMDGWVLESAQGDGASTSRQVVRLAGPPIPDGQASTFTVQIKGYDTSVDHLVPTVQVCSQGEEAWIDPDQASANAAPFLVATTAAPPPGLTDDTTVDGATPVAPTTDTQTPSRVSAGADADETIINTDEVSSSSSPLWIIIIVAIALAVVAGGVMLVRSRRNPAP